MTEVTRHESFAFSRPTTVPGGKVKRVTREDLRRLLSYEDGNLEGKKKKRFCVYAKGTAEEAGSTSRRVFEMETVRYQQAQGK